MYDRLLSRECATAGPLRRSSRRGVHWLPETEWVTFPDSLKIGCNRAIEDSLTISLDCRAIQWGQVCEANSLAPSLLNLCQRTRKQSVGSCKLCGGWCKFDSARLTYFCCGFECLETFCLYKSVWWQHWNCLCCNCSKCVYITVSPRGLSWFLSTDKVRLTCKFSLLS